MNITKPPAVVQQAEETERQLIARVKAISATIDGGKWEHGRLCRKWKDEFAQGRTDKAFAKLTGLSEDQVCNRRRVFERFSDSASLRNSPVITWSHCHVALSWTDADAEELLAEAHENEWSVSTMKEMHRIRRRIDRNDDLATSDSKDATPEAEHVADAAPYQPETSIVMPTGKAAQEKDAPSTGANTAESNPIASTAPKRTASTPSVEAAIDNIAALVVALKPQLDSESGHTLAKQLRRWADEVDASPSSTPARVVAAEWNMLPGVTTCKGVTPKRQTAVRQRMKEPFFKENWREALQKVAQSSFCTGTNDRGWKATLDWFLRPDTVTKVMEGQHDDRSGNAGKDVWRVPPSGHQPDVEDFTQANTSDGDNDGPV